MIKSIVYLKGFLYYPDNVAIPGRTGAMENWGLALYSENNLLYNPNWDNLIDARQIARVIGHELAHFVSNVIAHELSHFVSK